MFARLFVCIGLLAAAAGHPPVVSAQQTPPPPPLIDPETQKEIRDLKLKALDAERAGDLPKAHKLYDRILRLDPDDVLARQELRRLQAELSKEKEDLVTSELDRREREARAKEFAGLLEEARQGLAEAKSTGASEPLARAEKALERARVISRESSPELESLERSLQAEIAGRRSLRWQLWGFAGLAVLAVLVGTVAYIWRRSRTLEMVDGPQPGFIFRLSKESTTVGALQSEVDWAIPDPMRKVSRHHCDIIRRGRHYFLVDRSTNGTFLNGRPVLTGEPVLLKRGDRIGLGGAVTLRFH